MDEQRFRNVMAASPAPVTVVTTADEDGPAGSTVSAFMSLSLEPRLVAVALDRRSSLLPRVEATEQFGVNLLAAAQSEVALQFARPGADRFAGLSWFADAGLPRLHGTTAWLRCGLTNIAEAGDHLLLMGEVLDAAYSPLAPLVYAERLFGGHSGLKQREVPVQARYLAALAR